MFEKHTSIVVMKLKVAFGRSGAAGQLPMSICIVCRNESFRIHVFLLSQAVMFLGMFLLPHGRLTRSEEVANPVLSHDVCGTDACREAL